MDKRSSTSRTASLLTRLMRAGMAGCLMVAAALPLGAGCLNRPVGEQAPQTTNIFVEQFVNAVIDKIDLLFMIDNSISMADKQAFFAEAVPILVNRLINPICISEENPNVTQPAPAGGGNCSAGFQREFDAIRDIHIGIVSSSLGSFGGDGAAACSEPEKNDAAHLVGSLGRVTANTFNGLGFLAWDPDNLYGGTTQAAALITDFTTLVTQTGEQGCGYEASLEAWYRFLIDPLPYAQLTKADPQAPAVPATDGAGSILLDGAVLDQRRAFLRQDSLVAVVMLTDENDCSVAVPGFSWLVSLQNSTLPRSTSQCLSNPNDRCCQSCGSGQISGCPAPSGDAECAKGSYSPDLDPPNLRCFQQKRRFGIDLLFPTARYAVGLRSPQLCPGSPYGDMDCTCDFAQNVLRNNDCNVGAPVLNPLYTDLNADVPDTAATRDPSLVYLAAIVGVPWQDIATEDTRDTPDQLRYMTFAQLRDENRFAVIAGDIYNNVPPTDPFMVESIQPRGGTNPITGTDISPVGAGPLNPINGHEYNVLANDDLQYACIFPLGDKTRDCDAVAEGTGCDCDAMEMVDEAQNPLCQTGNAFSAQQTHAKGYPGLRHLDALQRFGANSIVASICPKVVSPANPENPNYGYNPAVSAIIDRLKEALGGRCLPRKLVPEVDEDGDGAGDLYGRDDIQPGQVPCRIVEAVAPHPTNGCPDVGSIAGRTDTREDAPLDKAVRDELERSDRCDAPGQPSCSEMCLYTIEQSVGGEQETCQQSEGEVTEFEGYCYIDPLGPEVGGALVGNPALVADCPASQKRLLRFVGTQTPRNNAITFIACSGAAVSQL